MSRFVNETIGGIAPYTPGEQPQDRQYIKLNTNENPYPPAPKVLEALQRFDAQRLRLYPDPDSRRLKAAAAKASGLEPGQVFVGGGSDEILGFLVMAFCRPGGPIYFADITYNFYKVYANLFGVRAVELPLQEDFTVCVEDYCSHTDGPAILANPNAPTGICLEQADIRRIVERDPNRLVVVDEAYVAFAPGQSCVPLVKEYDNLLVVQTMSKAASLAGMRIGLAYGNSAIIADLETVKYSFNPYNLDHISIEVGIAAVESGDYIAQRAEEIIACREWTREALLNLGFAVLPSAANYLFTRRPGYRGEWLYRWLRDRNILVRHFDKPRISDFVRISIGTRQEMETLVSALKGLPKEGN